MASLCARYTLVIFVDNFNSTYVAEMKIMFANEVPRFI
jgi:hypothetical protein